MPFSAQTLDFLFEHRMHNSRQWFKEHRAQFDELVQRPLVELSEALGETMLKIDPMLITEPKTGKTISRVYRDTRFSKDKMLFRANMWLIFIRDKKLYDGLPGFYVDLSEHGLSYGCGYYKMSSSSLESYRDLILHRDPAFLKAEDCLVQSEVFSLDGDLYKRSKFPDEPEEMQNWLNRKNVGANCLSKDFPLIFSQRLADKLKMEFLTLKPFYEFLCKVESHRLHLQAGE